MERKGREMIDLIMSYVTHPIATRRLRKAAKAYYRKEEKLRNAKELIRLHHNQIMFDIEVVSGISDLQRGETGK
jgi:response regulator of citrate/malate metabolism